MLVTPTGYVYEMYAPHQGAKSLRVRIETPDISFTKTKILQTTWQSALQVGEKIEGVIPTVAGSASLKDNTLFISLTNSHTSQATEVALDLLGGAEIGEAKGQVLSGEIHSHNTFTAPTQIAPHPFNVDCKATQVNLVLPAASVTTFKVHLLGMNH
jgi:alpha-N-arabinofuranosidase